MSGTIHLLSGDSPATALQVTALQRKGFRVRHRTSMQGLVADIETHGADAVLIDFKFDGGAGLSLCGKLKARWPELPILLVDDIGTVENAVATMRSGAFDYLVRPLRVDVLALALTRAVQHRRLRREVRQLRSVVAPGPIGGILGSSPPMRQLQELVRQVADSDVSVLISGETGTGKEMVARALHSEGTRAKAPFIPINCAAMPESLLESELFGHTRGAFTDARSSRAGLFVQATGGTLFLDEIGDMPLPLQPKLLRALQDRAVRPVGGDREQAFDARIVAATNQDLEARVDAGVFRRDLYYRINVIQIDLPPLRDRGGDVLLLAETFLAHAAARASKPVHRIAPPAAHLLMEHSWPGNVRELQNCIERAVALCRGESVGIDDLPMALQRPGVDVPLESPAQPGGRVETLAELERRHICAVLDRVGGNKSLAARQLGVDRKTLYRKLRAYGLGA